MARTLPRHVAAAICGHSEEIAREFYWTISDDDLDAALKTGIGDENPANEQIGAPTGAPIEGQFEALCGNSTDGGEISEDRFDQGKTREKTLMAAPGDSGQDGNNRRRGTSSETRSTNENIGYAQSTALSLANVGQNVGQSLALIGYHESLMRWLDDCPIDDPLLRAAINKAILELVGTADQKDATVEAVAVDSGSTWESLGRQWHRRWRCCISASAVG